MKIQVCSLQRPRWLETRPATSDSTIIHKLTGNARVCKYTSTILSLLLPLGVMPSFGETSSYVSLLSKVTTKHLRGPSSAFPPRLLSSLLSPFLQGLTRGNLGSSWRRACRRIEQGHGREAEQQPVLQQVTSCRALTTSGCSLHLDSTSRQCPGPATTHLDASPPPPPPWPPPLIPHFLLKRLSFHSFVIFC